jgi:hypothetical protein
MNRLQTRTCHRAPRHAGSARSGNADGGGGAGNADGGGDAGGAGGRFAPHGSMRHTSAATMRTRMPGLSGREGKEPPSAARCEGFTRRRGLLLSGLFPPFKGK